MNDRFFIKALIAGVTYETVEENWYSSDSDLSISLFAPPCLTSKQLKGLQLLDSKLWDDIEEQYKKLPDWLRDAVARADRAEYDARRERSSRGKSGRKGVGSKSGRKINARPRTGGHFVAVDSEGMELARAVVVRGREKTTFIDQRTCLWMAGGAEGFENRALVNLDGCSSKQIFDFLLSLPRQFASPDAKGGAPIFISFGFSYDVGQILKDFPYEKAWEVQNGRPWSTYGEKGHPRNLRRAVLWKDYAIHCTPGKSVTLYRLRNPDKPFKYVTKKDGEHTKIVDWVERIEIFDCFGFFQSSLVRAIEDMPGAVTPEELATISAGKRERGNFKGEDIEGIKAYTTFELKALVRMLNILREGLRNAIPDKPIELTRWQGAGSVAEALIELFLCDGKKDKETRAHIRQLLGEFEGESEDEKQRLDWVLRAYFGGRVDLVKQGNHQDVIHEYDLSSAYPSFAVELPNMKSGRWEKVINPTREQVETASMVSMFHVKTHAYENDLPFYALPFRAENGSIYYPPIVEGIYMRDHVIAAFKHYDYFERQNRLCHYGVNPRGASLEIVSAWLFHPATDEKPFAWIRELFDYRASLPKKDARGQVVKLGINSVYGKLCQAVGKRGMPPRFVSWFFAAAITAGTQRRVVEAGLTNPDAVVMFATDGVYSTKPLDVVVPEKKTLGGWEHTVAEAGGVFVQSGIYLLRYKPLKETYADRDEENKFFKTRTRGFSPQHLARVEGKSYNQAVAELLSRDIPQCWERGDPKFDFECNVYLGLGASAVSRRTWKRIGMWKMGPRSLKLDATEGKRRLERGDTKRADRLRKSRALKLVDLRATALYPGIGQMSHKSIPEWLSHDAGEDESENVTAGLS